MDSGLCLGTMCTEHWRAYVKSLREARKVAEANLGDEGTAVGPANNETDAA